MSGEEWKMQDEESETVDMIQVFVIIVILIVSAVLLRDHLIGVLNWLFQL